MLGSTTVKLPKTKNELIKSISNLPNGVKFSIHDIESSQDKQKLLRTIEQLLRKSSISVIVLEESS